MIAVSNAVMEVHVKIGRVCIAKGVPVYLERTFRPGNCRGYGTRLAVDCDLEGQLKLSRMASMICSLSQVTNAS